MQPDKDVVYELRGKSLEAALELNKKMHEELAPQIKAGGKLPVVRAFETKYKALYDAIGQNSRAVQIKVIDGGYPRAYACTPVCYFHPGDDKRVYMYAPIDYKGRTFEPEDARHINKQDAETLGIGLFAGGWSDPVPVIHRVASYGVQTPVDFDPLSPLCQFEHHPAPFDHAKTARLMIAFNHTKPYLVESGAITGVDDPDDVTFKCQMLTKPDGRPQLLVQAFNSKINAPVLLRDNAYFTPQSLDFGFYKIEPQAKTAGGMALQSFFDEIPPLSAEHIWAICDESDRRYSIKSPPPPRELIHLTPTAPWLFPKSYPAP